MLHYIINPFFTHRISTIENELSNVQKVQHDRLRSIIESNKNSPYLLSRQVVDLDSFDSHVKPISYDDIENDINQIKTQGINNLCCDRIVGMSRSSGTTSASKYIPITKESLHWHYKSGKDMISQYIHHHPNSKIVSGYNFSLTGSYQVDNGMVIGDISALINYFLHPFYQSFRVPNIELATIPSWEEKLEKIVPILVQTDIRWIAGVPSWMSVVIERMEQYSQRNISDIWPNLEVFFYGGVNIAPYQDFYTSKFRNLKLWQTYNASEGFVGMQMQPDDDAMVLLPNGGNYYEFIDKSDIDNENPNLYTINELNLGGIYEIVITNNSGLYRYRMGDMIEITHLNPTKIKIVGRTKCYINTYGEELMVNNSEMAIDQINKKYQTKLVHYNVAPLAINAITGYHRWMIEMNATPIDNEKFEKELDQIVQKLNSDYAAKRENDIILKQLKIIPVPFGTFDKWLDRMNRINVQSKIPKLTIDDTCQRSIMEVLHLNSASV